MSSKKEDKGAAAERIKAATMSATKGLSRAQAERAAAAATRNVNAYGQKEEGPSRWQERKELKRKMYLLSTEKAVTLGVLKKDVDRTSQCQKCYQVGHWTSECKNERVYLSRPSRSQLLKNPKLRPNTRVCYSEDFPDIKIQEEEKNKKDEKRGKKSKRKHRSDTESSSDSEASKSESESGSSSVSGSDSSSYESASSYSSSSDSEEDSRRRKRSSNRKKQKGRNKRYSSSSESSDYDSSSDSDSRERKRKSKKRSHRR